MRSGLRREAQQLVASADRAGFNVRPLGSGHGYSVRTAEGEFVTTVPGTPGNSRHLKAASIALRKAGLGEPKAPRPATSASPAPTPPVPAAPEEPVTAPEPHMLGLQRAHEVNERRREIGAQTMRDTIQRVLAEADRPLAMWDLAARTGYGENTVRKYIVDVPHATEQRAIPGMTGRPVRLYARNQETLLRDWIKTPSGRQPQSPAARLAAAPTTPAPAPEPPAPEPAPAPAPATAPAPAGTPTPAQSPSPATPPTTRVFEETNFKMRGGTVLVDEHGTLWLARPLVEQDGHSV